MRTPRKRKARGEGYLEGQLLIAMPIMTDKRFARSVIYMCAHSEEGAMGLIINQRAPHISFRELLKQLSISSGKGEDIRVDQHEVDVHVGEARDEKFPAGINDLSAARDHDRCRGADGAYALFFHEHGLIRKWRSAGHVDYGDVGDGEELPARRRA